MAKAKLSAKERLRKKLRGKEYSFQWITGNTSLHTDVIHFCSDSSFIESVRRVCIEGAERNLFFEENITNCVLRFQALTNAIFVLEKDKIKGNPKAGFKFSIAALSFIESLNACMRNLIPENLDSHENQKPSSMERLKANHKINTLKQQILDISLGNCFELNIALKKINAAIGSEFSETKDEQITQIRKELAELQRHTARKSGTGEIVPASEIKKLLTALTDFEPTKQIGLPELQKILQKTEELEKIPQQQIDKLKTHFLSESRAR